MALKASVFKFKLNVSDLERNVYEDFSLSLARHPSETDARMMLRLAAFARHASEGLSFGRGISTDDEPDLWRKDLTGQIELWIDLGTPDPERVRKACNRAQEVALYCYGERSLSVWWRKHEEDLRRFKNLSVFAISDEHYEALGGLAISGADLQCTLAGEELWLNSADSSVAIGFEVLRAAELG